ncbi:hypothetical protein GOBAR_DD30186 [Gossypium barbadense]|nr:hypothetical protein GOBAR_DD30186 [Gossypium barbadense]
MAEVMLHIYDVTNSGSDKTNNTIVHINKIFKDRIGLGGFTVWKILVEFLGVKLFNYVYGDDEWSFGFCEQGSGVFCCPSRKNPLYTYREFMVLGRTNSSVFKVNQILCELSREWPGTSYDLLSKNCNHFCDELCERLGVQKLPGCEARGNHILSFHLAGRSIAGCWVNRFANTGDAAIEMAENTALRFKQAKTEIVSASKVAYRFLVGVTSGSTACSEIETQEGDVVLQHQRQHNSAHTLQQTCHNSERPLRQRTPEELSKVEMAHQSFRDNRFHKKHSSDLLMRIQVYSSALKLVRSMVIKAEQKQVSRSLSGTIAEVTNEENSAIRVEIPDIVSVSSCVDLTLPPGAGLCIDTTHGPIFLIADSWESLNGWLDAIRLVYTIYAGGKTDVLASIITS